MPHFDIFFLLGWLALALLSAMTANSRVGACPIHAADRLIQERGTRGTAAARPSLHHGPACRFQGTTAEAGASPSLCRQPRPTASPGAVRGAAGASRVGPVQLQGCTRTAALTRGPIQFACFGVRIVHPAPQESWCFHSGQTAFWLHQCSFCITPAAGPPPCAPGLAGARVVGAGGAAGVRLCNLGDAGEQRGWGPARHAALGRRRGVLQQGRSKGAACACGIRAPARGKASGMTRKHVLVKRRNYGGTESQAVLSGARRRQLRRRPASKLHASGRSVGRGWVRQGGCKPAAAVGGYWVPAAYKHPSACCQMAQRLHVRFQCKDGKEGFASRPRSPPGAGPALAAAGLHV